MKKVLSVSVGEIALKGQNRSYFETQLIGQMIRVIKDIGYEEIYKDQGKIYIEADEKYFPTIINRLKKVFGLVYISPCIRVEKDMEDIEKAALLATKERLDKNKIETFKIETNRSDKKFSIKSPEVSRIIGAKVLKGFNNLKVDVHDPDLYVYIDIKERVYIYTEKIKAYGGMPVGTNGKGLLLLSGGIDSPVAGFIMAKRGVQINAVHYHSYPFTSERAEEKVKNLAKIMSRYTGKMKLHSVNVLNIQKAINEYCPEKEMTILSRRFMMRIAEEIAKSNNYNALITGESLGQVASQTIEGISVINNITNLPILRPLIGMDKVDIIDISRDIETYETSIIPHKDSCTIFLPKHPVIKPKLKDIEESEKALDIDGLVKDAIDNIKVYDIE
ncbi:MAG TPA: tRNA uracil 4-sulfurtransferase ThiI [Tissierellaceae bacterium]|nr:tRNA uracil 4-sulfurtransferase ThiI [Tissierellaceae bacterium]